MSQAGCEEASPHPIPAGLIHSGQLTPRARSTAALAAEPGRSPELAPGSSCTVHAHGAHG